MYGSTPLEDIINYNVVARCLTEWTSSNGGVPDQTSISEGVGNKFSDLDNTFSVRSALHGVALTGSAATPSVISVWNQPNAAVKRRYQVTLGLGLFTQGKLLPTKFMASQLAVELTLAKVEDCLVANGFPISASNGVTFVNPTYSVTDVNMIPEILEFDSSYDNMFLKGLQEGGVPIKFASWHFYQFSYDGSNNANILINERSRSVKSIFTVIRRQNSTLYNDAGATLANVGPSQNLESYQYRIGGRYFPASPVQVTSSAGPNLGGCEAFLELQKALHTVGDSALSTNTSFATWARPFLAGGGNASAASSVNESDGALTLDMMTSGGAINIRDVVAGVTARGVPCHAFGSDNFCFATCLETTSGMEISGLNAEEQSDISLNIKWNGSGPGGNNFMIETYVFYDAMVVLRENNVLCFINQRCWSLFSKIKVCFVLIKWIMLKLKLTLP